MLGLGWQLIVKPTLKQWEYQLRESGDLSAAVDEAFERASRIFTDGVRGSYPPRNYIGRAYIAGALTGMPDEIKKRYEETSRICFEYDIFGYAPHLFGTDPVKHPNVPPHEVRAIDFLWGVVVPCFHINWLDPLAANLIEEGWAEICDVPAIYLLPEEKYENLSRLIKGMKNVKKVITYSSYEDGLKQISEYLKQIKAFIDSNQFSQICDFFDAQAGITYRPKSSISVPVSEISLVDLNTGEIGKLVAHDWKESGTLTAEFPNGVKRCYPDGNPYDGRFRQGENPNFFCIRRKVSKSS